MIRRLRNNLDGNLGRLLGSISPDKIILSPLSRIQSSCNMKRDTIFELTTEAGFASYLLQALLI